MTDEQIRQAFEKWFLDKFKQKHMPIDSSHVDFCWEGYKAALASLEQVGCFVVDKLDEPYPGSGFINAKNPPVENFHSVTPLYRIKEKS